MENVKNAKPPGRNVPQNSTRIYRRSFWIKGATSADVRIYWENQDLFVYTAFKKLIFATCDVGVSRVSVIRKCLIRYENITSNVDFEAS